MRPVEGITDAYRDGFTEGLEAGRSVEPAGFATGFEAGARWAAVHVRSVARSEPQSEVDAKAFMEAIARARAEGYEQGWADALGEVAAEQGNMLATNTRLGDEPDISVDQFTVEPDGTVRNADGTVRTPAPYAPTDLRDRAGVTDSVTIAKMTDV